MCAESAPGRAGPDAAIVLDGVSKYYEIYEKPIHRLYQMLWRGRRQFYKPFWALRDISFELRKGDCLGVIGRNGAGKSTLLQIIAGTLAPSSGTVASAGRVAALLELGSGFNPEFTGRENARLNAAIFGLDKEEIDARFDSIAAFADIGEFMDQPVKSYSSGMVVRLAFAVIAHVDADVLIIDEALAVGDAFFTQKCMRFIRNFIASHTVLFVSHDIAAVNSLCNRALLLENGAIKKLGEPREITDLYLRDLYEARQGASVETAQEKCGSSLFEPFDYRDMRQDFINHSCLRNDIRVLPFDESCESFGKKELLIRSAVLRDAAGAPLAWVVGGENVRLDILLEARKNAFSPIVGFLLRNRFGQGLFGDNTCITYARKPLYVRAGQLFRATFSFAMPILEPGDYSITLAVAEGSQLEHVQHDWKHDAILLKAVGENMHRGLIGIPMREITLEIAGEASGQEGSFK